MWKPVGAAESEREHEREGNPVKLRRFAAQVSGAAILAAAATVGATGVAAADDLPRFGLYGDNINSVGDANFCTGTINVTLATTPGRPGLVQAKVTPLGFRNGPCGAWVHINFYSLALPIWHDIPVYVFAGDGPGASVTVDLPTGSGPNQIAASTWPLANQGVSWLVLVP